MIGPGIARISGKAVDRSPATLRVDVIADFVCPWSYLGKKRLDAALRAVHGPRLVSWYPFQLNPDIPPDGKPLDMYLADRFGSSASIGPVLDELAVAGRAEGIDFRFDRVTRMPNTLRAHRLMTLAGRKGADTSAIADTLFGAFFNRGLDLGDREVLAEIGSDFGLRRFDVITALEDESAANLVLAREAQLRQSGVSGVPGFLVNQRLFVVGAQSTDSLVSVFDRAMFGAESDLPVSPTLH